MYCHFGLCRRQSGCRGTFWKTADAFWIIFRQALLQNTLPAAISQFLDTLFLWLMYCHFGPCWRQSGGGKTFWKTADTFCINFQQALLQNTLPAAISWFLDPLFLWQMYSHFGLCRRQCGSGKTFWKTADAFGIIFRQAYLQIIFPAAISWFLEELFLWPIYCHFGLCWRQSGGGKTFWNTANASWINFRQALLQITLPAAISQFLDPLFLWPMYCHFWPCWRQSWSGKTFWKSADTFGIILRQAYLQIIFLTAISRFLDPLFLWQMYCHFWLCRRQSGSGKTFWKTADAFGIIFRQAYLQIIFPAAISWFLDPLFLWSMYCHCHAGDNPEVGKHFDRLPMHFG